MWQKLGLAICLIISAFVFIVNGDTKSGYDAPVTVLGAQTSRSVIETEIASARSGLPTLIEDPALNRVAEARLQDMMAHGYYGHETPTGESALRAVINQKGQTSTGFICENLHLTEKGQTEAILADWLLSTTGHKECLLHQKPTRFGFARGLYDTVRFEDSNKTLYMYVLILSE